MVRRGAIAYSVAVNASPSQTPPSQVRLRIDRETCHKLELVLAREWLETDGLGGYASSTPLMCHTRRYHGLYVVVPPGLEERHVLLSRFEESLHGAGRGFDLSMARYSGCHAPLGHQYVEGFELRPYPRTTYRIGGARVHRDVLLSRESGAVFVRYSLEGDAPPLELRLRPLLPFRRADALTFENIHLDPRVQRFATGVRVKPYAGMAGLSLFHSAGSDRFDADPLWYRGIEYRAELERGYDGHEDQFSPGVFRLPLSVDAPVVVAASCRSEILQPAQVLAGFDTESKAREAGLAKRAGGVRDTLESTADSFLYRAPGGRTGVIAGFPWFGEWGRDTFLSLPGLLLSRGRVEECGEALEAALVYLRDGLLPNIFAARAQDAHYGSADAALWFARAVRLYDVAGGSRARLRDRLEPALRKIARAYLDGTALGMRVDDKGTLLAGDATTNATWMDARTSDGPVTPRQGAAVELNALWYFLLAYLERLARDDGRAEEARGYETRRRLCTRSFLRRFWLEDERRLADVWTPQGVDRRLRPNMVIAAALEFSPLSRGKRTDIVRHARLELLTPFGLRTLAPFEADYVGNYQGDMRSRDMAYHQGTVWPWLLGFYCEAYLRAYGADAYRLDVIRGLLERFGECLETQGMGHVSEVFDGDPPHRPGGTIAQAWSSAELLRAFAMVQGGGP